jgi:hypothetical protein
MGYKVGEVGEVSGLSAFAVAFAVAFAAAPGPVAAKQMTDFSRASRV